MKIEDELPVPHHSGYVDAPADDEPLFTITKRLRVKLQVDDLVVGRYCDDCDHNRQ